MRSTAKFNFAGYLGSTAASALIVLSLGPFQSLGAATCPALPDVEWWSTSHNQVSAIVAKRYAGDWDKYIKRWDRYRKRMKDVLRRNSVAVIRSRGIKLQGDSLAAHVKDIEKRLVALRCLSLQTTQAKIEKVAVASESSLNESMVTRRVLAPVKSPVVTITKVPLTSEATNPLHPGHAPCGLLKENMLGARGMVGVPHAVQRGCSENRIVALPARTSASPSPSANATARESASRPRTWDSTLTRSTTTSTPPPSKGMSGGTSSNRITSSPTNTRTNPMARSRSGMRR